MSSDAKGKLAFGYNVGWQDGPWPEWFRDLLEDESQLPKDLELYYYGNELNNGCLIALKRCSQWVWDTQPQELTEEMRKMLAPSLEEMHKLDLIDALKKIPGFDVKRPKPKWMLLGDYG